MNRLMSDRWMSALQVRLVTDHDHAYGSITREIVNGDALHIVYVMCPRSESLVICPRNMLSRIMSGRSQAHGDPGLHPAFRPGNTCFCASAAADIFSRGLRIAQPHAPRPNHAELRGRKNKHAVITSVVVEAVVALAVAQPETGIGSGHGAVTTQCACAVAA